MPPMNTGTGTGKEKEPLTLEGLALKFDQLIELVRSLTVEAMALSGPSFKLFDDLRQEMEADPTLHALKVAVVAGARGTKWRLVDGLVLIDGHVFISPTSTSLPFILDNAHGAGHEGTQKTLHRVRSTCPAHARWSKNTSAPASYVSATRWSTCTPTACCNRWTCPRRCGRTWPWTSSRGSRASTVVDLFSKYGHFIALGHPYTATSVARAFFDNIICLHGIPSSIVSDRDPVFTSNFWKELFALLGTKLNMSSTFHPQTDGQSEAANKIITMYLWCLAGDRPRH
jgi:hypothetical protein